MARFDLNSIHQDPVKRHWVIAGILFSFLFILLMFSSYGILKRVALEWEKEDKVLQIDKLKKNYDSLKTIRERLIYDSTEIEKLARENYGMARQGEDIYFLKEKKRKKEN